MFTSTFSQSPHGDELKIKCNQCHSPYGWNIDVNYMRFEHNETDFMLEGAHTQTDCKSCHTSLVFDEAPNQCASCHTDLHSMTVGNDCARCHTSNSWLVDNIPEIHEENGFPLIGAHGTLSCIDCHDSEPNLRFDNLGNECISCHQEDYLTTQSPNHIELGFSNDCIECHSPLALGWDSDIIDHDFFPLTLGHDIPDCRECHLTPNYSDTSPECITCHQTDYDTTTDPDHGNAGFSTDCIECHTTNPGWTPATINHDFFPLTLGHDIQDCTECHLTPNYSDTSPECITCHQTDYDTTTDPDHSNAGFPTDCIECHTTNPGWTPATINHDFFPLTLGHDIQDCTECHQTSNYSDTSPECVSCHQTDYDTTTNPDHSSAGYPTDCISCHSTNPGWTPAVVDHDFFPLTLGHDIQDCTQCHTNGNYSNLSPDCVACHQTNYDTTSNPNHNNAQFAVDCVDCHTTNPNWTPVNWDHNFYPLNGAHATIADDCIACHTGENYINTPNTCVGCHLEDYNNTTDPNHSSAQFPQDCMECHNEVAWEPATFDHDGMYFPIYSGKHNGEWDQCIECHTNPNDYSFFNCLQCHEHNDQNQVDNDHDHPGEPEFDNYVYESNACFECHPNP